MKILVAAPACIPNGGSERYVGWTAVETLAREHELWVLTHGWSKEAIEAEMRDHPLRDRLHFFFLRPPMRWSENRLIARGQDWLEYRLWMKEARQTARQLIREVPFDLAHHVTVATWRLGSILAGLGLPWVWGPIGGGENFPLHLLGQLSPQAAAFELLREISNRGGIYLPSARRAARSATMALPNNRETEEMLLRLGAPAGRIQRLSQSFLTQERLKLLTAPEKKFPATGERLEIIGGGNLEGRKGVSLALEALAIAKNAGLNFRYRFLGRGPEMAHLRRMADRLGLSGQVTFGEWLEGNAYPEALKAGHIYLLPSLREGAPLTQLEAMAAGCVPLVADCGGSGLLAREAGQIPAAPDGARSMIAYLGNELLRLGGDPQILRVASEASARTAQENHSAAAYLRDMSKIYELTKSFAPATPPAR